MKPRIIAVMVFLLTFIAGSTFAQDYQNRTARELYDEVKTEALKLASDVQLVMVFNGSDLVLPGATAHNWQYFFKSESNHTIYQFAYEEDDREISRIHPVSDEGLIFNTGMNTLPDNWIDSDEAIENSDIYGGSDYRNTHTSDSYHIDIRYLPAVKDGVNALYSKAICEVGYAGEDAFSIPIDIITGEFHDVVVTTARQLLPDVKTVAERISSDAELIKVNNSYVGKGGKSWEWFYIYKSINQQNVFSMVVYKGKIGKQPDFNGDDDTNIGTPSLPDLWMDSDSAVLIAEERGGSQFRLNNPGCHISMQLKTPECDNALWDVNYDATYASENYLVYADSNSGIIHTAHVYLQDVIYAASQVFNDAQLVFVFGHGVSESGSVNLWNYLFKSPSQQELVHFTTTASGAICQKEEIDVPLEENTLLQFNPIPENWFDSDTVIQIIEEYGGEEFRQNSSEWNINMYLEQSENNGKFYWHVIYSNPSDSRDFWMRATEIKKYTSFEYINMADSVASEIAEDAQLIYVWSNNVNLDGNSEEWQYFYKSEVQQQIFEIIIENAEIIVPDELSIDWLDQGFTPIPELWLDSDSAIIIAESLGGETFREYYELINIDMNLSAVMVDYSEWAINYNANDNNRQYLVNTLTDYSSNSWPITFGGTGFDVGYCIKESQDEGYIIAGVNSSWSAGKKDAWIIKVYENGILEWDHTFGGEEDEIAQSVRKTTGFRGYILGANTESFGSGSNDAWLLKTLNNGNERWSQTIGNSTVNYQYDVYQTAHDTGYIFTGKTQTQAAADFDVWLHKTNKAGVEQWSKTFGGNHDDISYSIEKTSDNGFILAGSTASFGSGGLDAYLIKTDLNGNDQWNKTFGGNEDDVAYSVKKTTDNGFIFTGYTASSGQGGQDVFLVKTDENGEEQWSQTFGGENDDIGKCVIQTSDGGYVITGSTSSEGEGGKDLWLIKTDTVGNKIWSQTFGGENDDFGESVIQNIHGDYLITGGTYSYGEGDCDLWLVKTNSNGFATQNKNLKRPEEIVLHQNYPNPFEGKTTIEFELNENTKACIYLYNFQGKLIKTIAEKNYNPGKYQVTFNAEGFSPGIYFYKLQTTKSFIVKKMVLL